MTLVLDDVPDELLEELERDAARHARSMRDEAVERLSRPTELRDGHGLIPSTSADRAGPTPAGARTPTGTATLAKPCLRVGDPLPPPRTPEEVRAILDDLKKFHEGRPQVRHMTAEELREARDEGRP